MCTREGRTESALTRLALIRRGLIPALAVLALCWPDVASAQLQSYRVDTNKILTVRGDVKRNSVAVSVSGHDLQHCVGVRDRRVWHHARPSATRRPATTAEVGLHLQRFADFPPRLSCQRVPVQQQQLLRLGGRSADPHR
jgi:hypothetical protein